MMMQALPKYKTRVLVVEMDPMCRRVVERVLDRSCDIVTTCDFEEIIQLLENNTFDTLFVDFDFPAPGAIALFEFARRQAPETRCVLMTGENVSNLQHYLSTGLIDACVTRTTPARVIEAEVTSRSSSNFP